MILAMVDHVGSLTEAGIAKIRGCEIMSSLKLTAQAERAGSLGYDRGCVLRIPRRGGSLQRDA